MRRIFSLPQKIKSCQIGSILKQPQKLKSSKSFLLNAANNKLETSLLFPYPRALNNEQEEFLRDMIPPSIKFFDEKNDPAKNEDIEGIEPETNEGLKQMGLYGMQAGEEWGGLGLSNVQYARLVDTAGGYDLGVGIALGAHQSIGYKGIMLFGTEAQKRRFLPRLTGGQEIAAYCLTEPGSGSDAQSISTRATKSEDGSHFLLNGSKVWISNGGIANIFTVFAKQKMPDSGKDKITAFIVDRAFGGVTSSPPEHKMGIKASNTASVYFDEVCVPADCVLGEEGAGFKVAMEILNNGRFGMAATLSGTMRACIGKACQHAAQREQFGGRLRSYGAVQEKLALMTCRQYATEAMAYALAANMDIQKEKSEEKLEKQSEEKSGKQAEESVQTEAAASKVFASEAAWFCVDEAIQVLGGMGYMRGAGLEKVMRDLRIFRIFEGTNDILRQFIALLACQHVGANLQAASVTQQARAALSLAVPALFGGGGGSGNNTEIAQQLSKLIGGGSGGDAIGSQVTQQLARSIGQMSRLTTSLVMQHKKGVISRQMELRRLAEMMMEVYAMAASLSRCADAIKRVGGGGAALEQEVRIVRLICATSSARVDQLARETQRAQLEPYVELVRDVSDTVCDAGGLPHPSPLYF